MKRGSIRFRLIALWAVILVAILGVSTYGLQVLFERSILRRTIDELSLDLKLLSEALSLDADGAPALTTAPRDPLFQVVYGGRYWQVLQGTEPALSSPSLWGHKLAIDTSRLAAGTLEPVRLPGPQDQNLFGVALRGAGRSEPGDPPLTVLVAADFHEIEMAKQRFAGDLAAGALLIAVLLVVAACSQVVIGLRPLRELQARLGSVRRGDSARLEGTFPHEVMPLVTETNALLDAQDAALATARTRAADLAHGLKTPLAIMTAKSRSLRRRGDITTAIHLDQQIETMRRHVERELARARSRGAGPTHHVRVDTAESLDRITGAMQLLPKGQDLDWQLALMPRLSIAVDPVDFDELMGNLIDNAHKWARSTVVVRSVLANGMAEFHVEDDGPGIEPGDIERVLQRGERSDPSVAGSGLGLAIVSDLIAAYKGSFELGRSTIGGTSAVVRLPDAKA